MKEREIVKTTHETANEIAQAELYRNRQDEECRRQELYEAYRAGEMAGAIDTNNLHVGLGMVARLISIRQVKDEKLYRCMPGIETWDTFCEKKLKQDRRTVERDLDNLAVLGEQFLDLCVQFSVSKKDIRRLRYAAKEGEILVEGNAVTIGGEQIPFDPDHAEDLEAAIEGVLENKDKAIEDRDGLIKAKDRHLAEKEKVIVKQEKDLAKLTRTLEARGFKPGEEEFCDEIEKLRTAFGIIAGKLDPESVADFVDPERGGTERAKAAYLGLVQTIASYSRGLLSDAKLIFQDPELEPGWTPPAPSAQETAAPAPAQGTTTQGDPEKSGLSLIK